MILDSDRDFAEGIREVGSQGPKSDGPFLGLSGADEWVCCGCASVCPFQNSGPCHAVLLPLSQKTAPHGVSIFYEYG